MKQLNETERQEWLAQRSTGIGGSDVASIMGLSPFRTAVDVWLDKLGRTENKTSNSMYFGTILEGIVCKEFEKRTNMKLQNVNCILRNPKESWQIANIDRAIINPAISGNVRPITDLQKIEEAGGRLLTTDVAFEAKTSNAFSTQEWGASQEDEIRAGKEPEEHQIPLFYETQLQWYSGVLNLRGMYLAVLIGGNDYRMYWVKARPDIFEALTEKCRVFWQENVLKQIEPESKDPSEIIKIYQRSDPDSMLEADSDMAVDYGEAVRINSEIKALESSLEAIKLRMKATMKDKEILTLDGKKIASYKSVTSNRFDSKSFKKDSPDIYAKYLAPSETRVFRLF